VLEPIVDALKQTEPVSNCQNTQIQKKIIEVLTKSLVCKPKG